MEERATSISTTLGEFLENPHMGFGTKGYSAYVRYLGDIAMSDIWIVDDQLNLIVPPSREGKNDNFAYGDLPTNAEKVVFSVLEGETTFSDSFSTLLGVQTLTVGTPIKYNNQTVGVVLLHSPITETNGLLLQGYLIFGLSVVIALLIGWVVAFWFARAFTRPLSAISETTMDLANGDYHAQTGVVEEDEIGSLAKNVDILAGRLLKARQESDALEKMRKDFVANISHELKTPLTVIRGSLEALNDGVIEEGDIPTYYSQMLTESKGLERLVADLLDLSRLQNPYTDLAVKEIDLRVLMEDVMRSAAQLGLEKGNKITLKNECDEPIVIGDYQRVRQLLMIIISNAIKFSPIGEGIDILVSKDDRVQVSVLDHGCGISDSDLPFIFDRFHKSNSKENQKGTGLGLAIAKEICTQYGYEITATSRVGDFTCFTIYF